MGRNFVSGICKLKPKNIKKPRNLKKWSKTEVLPRLIPTGLK